MGTLLQQANKNLLAIISLVVALSALGYNTYRNELTEENRNVRFAGFSLLQELAEMQQLIDYAHYDKDAVKGNPITGWQHLLYGELLFKQLQVTDKGHGNEISSGNC